MKTKIALYLFDNKKSFVRYWHCDSLVCMQSPNLSQWCHFMQATKLLMYIWQNRIKCLFYVHVWFIDTFVIQLEWTAIFNVATLIGPFCWESPTLALEMWRGQNLERKCPRATAHSGFINSSTCLSIVTSLVSVTSSNLRNRQLKWTLSTLYSLFITL